MQPLPNLQEKPSQEEIDRVDAWRQQKYVERYNQELEQLDDEVPNLLYRGFEITADIAFSKKALVGLAKLAVKTQRSRDSLAMAIPSLNGPELDGETSNTRKP